MLTRTVLFDTYLWLKFLLGDFEQAEQADAAQHGDAHDGHDVHVDQDELQHAGGDHKAVEAVEQRHEVGGQTQGVHLHEHLNGKHGQQELVGVVWKRRKDEGGMGGREGY